MPQLSLIAWEHTYVLWCTVIQIINTHLTTQFKVLSTRQVQNWNSVEQITRQDNKIHDIPYLIWWALQFLSLFALAIQCGWNILLQKSCNTVDCIKICAKFFLESIQDKCRCFCQKQKHTTNVCVHVLWWQTELHDTNANNVNIAKVHNQKTWKSDGLEKSWSLEHFERSFLNYFTVCVLTAN